MTDPMPLEKQLSSLSALIQEQMTPVFAQKGIVLPVICSSTLLCLGRIAPATVTDIAKQVGHPHQSVAQHLGKLLKLGIIKKQADTNDKRRTEYVLTAVGQQQIQKLHAYNQQAEKVFETLAKTLGADLPALLLAAEEQLRTRPLTARFKPEPKSKKQKDDAAPPLPQLSLL